MLITVFHREAHLAPTLILTYVNDLCNLDLDNSRIVSFADDTALIFEGDTWPIVEKFAENGLRKVIKWLDDNLLTINIPKTKFICFRINAASNPPSDFTITAHSSLCKVSVVLSRVVTVIL